MPVRFAHFMDTLAFVEGNLNAQEIFEKKLWPVAAKYFPSEDFIFLDDNAPVHMARPTVEYKLRNKIKSLSWPAQSADINIIAYGCISYMAAA